MEIHSEIEDNVTVKTMNSHGHSQAIDTPISVTISESVSNDQGELEALANIQEELDRLTADHQHGEVTHAMITADGTAVPLTLNPETGQYMTQDGQPIDVQPSQHTDEPVQHQTSVETQEVTSIDEEPMEVDTPANDQLITVRSDGNQIVLTGGVSHMGSISGVSSIVQQSSPRKAHPQFKVMAKDGGIKLASTGGAGVLRILNPDGTLSDLSTLQNQNIRILNADGTLSALSESQNIRFVSQDGSTVGRQQEVPPQPSSTQQLKILNPDGTITVGTPMTVRPSVPSTISQPQQIRILNDSGGISPGSYRIISPMNSASSGISTQHFDNSTHLRVVNSSVVKSPVKGISLSQGSGSGQGMLKILPKSPINTKSPQKITIGSTIKTVDGKTIIIGSPQKPPSQQQQIIIRPGNAISKENATKRIIRFPNAGSESGIQQIPVGSKVQYVRVMTTQSTSTSPKTQMVTVKSGVTPILPSTVKPISVKQISSNSNVVKIALPQQLVRNSSTPAAVKNHRVILPSPATTTASQLSQGQTKVISITENKVPLNSTVLTEIQSKDGAASHPESETKAVQFRPIMANSHAYEAFLSKKEDKPKLSPPGGTVALEAAGVRPRKPCNCTKSQCLKLYCDCFANGEFCFNCNCTNCFNNLHHERQRQKSIKQCLDRNPTAFKPKIGRALSDGERRHNKGCNCKRSGCLKNYCECYEAKIPCTNACKCIGCKNIEDDLDGPPIKKEPVQPGGSNPMPSAAAPVTPGQARKVLGLRSRLAPFSNSGTFKPVEGIRQPFSFITTEVVEATCQCLLAQATDTETNELESEAMIIEEFGRCLKEIIEMARKSSSAGGSLSQDSSDT